MLALLSFHLTFIGISHNTSKLYTRLLLLQICVTTHCSCYRRGLEMEEIQAFANFVNYFTQNFSKFSSCYHFSMTDLRTKISELSDGNDKLLVFYLHHSLDELSLNFCNLLQDSEIEVAFRNDKLILYCWDIENDDLKPKLIEGFTSAINDTSMPFIKRNKSAIFLIKAENNVPTILNTYDDSMHLLELRDVLLSTLPVEVFTALKYQQLMVEFLGDRDYDSFEENEHKSLKNKIGYALYGPPTESDGAEYKTDYQKEINRLFLLILKENNAVCKWNERVVISFVFVCAEALPKDKKERARKCEKQDEKYNPDADFVPYPVFILRKCKNDDSSKACRIVIDHEGRVYKTWAAYLDNNRLPPCKMIYPKDGRYHSDNDVEFDTKPSPACDLTKKVANVTDVVAGVGGLVAGGASIAASSATVLAAAPLLAVAAPVVVPVAVAVGIGSGIYAAGRSIYSLVDRDKHKQKINLSNSESRAAYLSLVGGVLSVGMFGAARTLSFLAGRGVQLGQGTKYILYGVNGVGLTVNGIGIGNNIYEAYQAKNASPLLIAQIGASILFFGHSLYNFKAVANIIEDSQTKALSEIENSLRSNRHRRTFNKLLKESIRTQGERQGKASVISSMRNMENVDDVMATLTRSNKVLNNQGIRFSTEGGQILLNGVPVKMMDFSSMNTASQTSYLSELPPLPENLTPNAQLTITQDVDVWLKHIVMGWGIASRSKTVKQLVDEIFNAFDSFVRDYIMDISKRFFNKLDINISRRLTQIITEATVKLMKWIINRLMDSNVFKKILNHQTISSEEIDDMADDLHENFTCQYVDYEYDAAKDKERKEMRRSNNKTKVKTCCTSCGGYYYT